MAESIMLIFLNIVTMNKMMENRKEIVQVITDKHEIEKNYYTNVAQAHGLIHLDMNDFYSYANKHKLVMEVIVDSPAPVPDQIKTAVAEVKKHGIETIAAIILSVSYNSLLPLTIEELNSVSDFFDCNEIKRGVQENDNILNDRSISLFVFE